MEQKKEKNIPLEQTLEEIKKMKAEKLAQQNTPPSIPPVSTPTIPVPPVIEEPDKKPKPESTADEIKKLELDTKLIKTTREHDEEIKLRDKPTVLQKKEAELEMREVAIEEKEDELKKKEIGLMNAKRQFDANCIAKNSELTEKQKQIDSLNKIIEKLKYDKSKLDESILYKTNKVEETQALVAEAERKLDLARDSTDRTIILVFSKDGQLLSYPYGETKLDIKTIISEIHNQPELKSIKRLQYAYFEIPRGQITPSVFFGSHTMGGWGL
jgi:hypothetical protein